MVSEGEITKIIKNLITEKLDNYIKKKKQRNDNEVF